MIGLVVHMSGLGQLGVILGTLAVWILVGGILAPIWGGWCGQRTLLELTEKRRVSPDRDRRGREL